MIWDAAQQIKFKINLSWDDVDYFYMMNMQMETQC